MFRFNYDRATTLHSVEKLPGGKLRVNTFVQGSFDLPRNSVRLITTKRLSGTSLRVVDFGNAEKGKYPIAAIIAAGAECHLPKL